MRKNINYAVNIGAHNKFKNLGLLQMSDGIYDFIGYMLVAALALFVTSILIREARSRLRG